MYIEFTWGANIPFLQIKKKIIEYLTKTPVPGMGHLLLFELLVRRVYETHKTI